MSDGAGTETVVEQPAGTEQPEAPPLSVTEHAKLHGEQHDKTPEGEKAVLVEKAAHHSAEQQREKDGQFRDGKQRMRSKDAVERIGQLTGRAKTAEERVAALETEVATLRTQRAPAAQIAKVEAKIEQAQPAVADDPEPTEDDPKHGGDYGKYLIAQARWAARDERRQEREADRVRVEQTKQEDTHRQILRSWGDRLTAAKGKYQDFEAVAFAPTRIPSGSSLDAWIMEDDAGAEILYHLQSHPDELDSLLGMPVLTQVKTLALLSQRLLSPALGAAGTTGSVPERKVMLPPRPPNPVRTEAQRVGGPPPTDGTLSVMDHAKKFKRA